MLSILRRRLLHWQRFLFVPVLIIVGIGYIRLWNRPMKLGYIARHQSMPPNSTDLMDMTEFNLSSKINDSKVPLCPSDSPYLIGRVNDDLLDIANDSLKLTEWIVQKTFPEISPGGHWNPSQCRARQKVAIIVPFRDRQSHLPIFLAYMIPILKRQQLEFFFVLVEQAGQELFNKGRLYNAAFTYAKTLKPDCVVFHDVDMVPEDDRNLYSCFEFPRHISPFTNELNYVLWYNNLVGGVLSMKPEQYEMINGYSNEYWGWGGEDDDIGFRILSKNMSILRPSELIGRFTMLSHEKRTRDVYRHRHRLLATAAKRAWRDGLRSTVWSLQKQEVRPLYHWLLVNIGAVPPELRRKTTVATTTATTATTTTFVGESHNKANVTVEMKSSETSSTAPSTDLKIEPTATS